MNEDHDYCPALSRILLSMASATRRYAPVFALTPAVGPARRTAAAPPLDTHRRRAANAHQSPDYKLVPGDKLRIEVYKDAQLSQALQVRPGRQDHAAAASATSPRKGKHRPSCAMPSSLAEGIQHQPDRHRDRRRDGAAGVLRDGRSEYARHAAAQGSDLGRAGARDGRGLHGLRQEEGHQILRKPAARRE